MIRIGLNTRKSSNYCFMCRCGKSHLHVDLATPIRQVNTICNCIKTGLAFNTLIDVDNALDDDFNIKEVEQIEEVENVENTTSENEVKNDDVQDDTEDNKEDKPKKSKAKTKKDDKEDFDLE